MFTFYAHLFEKDLANYTNTLLLPPYMSYLKREPINWQEQAHNADGREPFLIVYSGDGRLEEIRLTPQKHAIPILASLPLGIDTSKIGLSNESIWIWRPIESGIVQACGGENTQVDSGDNVRDVCQDRLNCNQKFGQNSQEDSRDLKKAAETIYVLDIYFLPLGATLGIESSQIFSARDAYVSVSRKEIFLGESVIKRYLLSRIQSILSPNSPLLKEPVFDNAVSSLTNMPDDSKVKLICLANGYRFEFSNLGGELIFDSSDSFRDIVQFARLERALGYLSDFVQLDWTKINPLSARGGILFDLETVSKESEI